MDLETAETVVKELLDCSGRLDRSVALVRDKCGEDEFKAYRRRVASAMAEITETLVAVSKLCPDVVIWPTTTKDESK